MGSLHTPSNPIPVQLSTLFPPDSGATNLYLISWTEVMSPVDSPVNIHEWPIPLSPGVTLEAVRNELLNLGAQYVWLDVVCLRQKSSLSIRESLRMKEWMIDVPMIGKVYEPSQFVGNVIRYFNGWKVFRRNGWHDEQDWSQRAWTLQGVSGKYIEAGLPRAIEDPLEQTQTDDSGTGIHRLRDHLKIGEIRLGRNEWSDDFIPGQIFTAL